MQLRKLSSNLLSHWRRRIFKCIHQKDIRFTSLQGVSHTSTLYTKYFWQVQFLLFRILKRNSINYQPSISCNIRKNTYVFTKNTYKCSEHFFPLCSHFPLLETLPQREWKAILHVCGEEGDKKRIFLHKQQHYTMISYFIVEVVSALFTSIK